MAPDSREAEARAQISRPAFAPVANLDVRFLSYGELARHREAVIRFGESLKAVRSISKPLIPLAGLPRTRATLRLELWLSREGRIKFKTVVFSLIVMAPVSAGAEPSAVSVQGLPAHYHQGHGGCRPAIGYSFIAATRDHPSTYPKLVLRAFNGEVIGMVFEADAAAGWQPWYDQPVGKPISHGSGPAHYSQTIYLKPPPSAADCTKSSGPGKPQPVLPDR